MRGWVPLIWTTLRGCHDPSAAWAGAHETERRKKPAHLGRDDQSLTYECGAFRKPSPAPGVFVVPHRHPECKNATPAESAEIGSGANDAPRKAAATLERQDGEMNSPLHGRQPEGRRYVGQNSDAGLKARRYIRLALLAEGKEAE